MAVRNSFSVTRAFNLRRAFPLFLILTVLACAYLQARAMNALLSSWLLGSLVRPFAPPPESARATREPSPRSAHAFDTLVPTPSPSLASMTDCSDVRLSIVSEFGDPAYSLATLMANGDSRAKLRRRGDRLGNRVIAWIGTDMSSHEPAVWLNDASSIATCRVHLFRPPSPAGPVTFRPPSPAEPVTPITPITPVTPELAAPSLRDLIGPVRAKPELEAGKLVGLRLLGVRPGSLLGQIGLRNGDRIDSINGYSIADPEQALMAYARLRTEQHFKLRVSRAGQPVEIDYQLTDSVRREIVKSGLPN
jgi:general secretion pathway protein C